MKDGKENEMTTEVSKGGGITCIANMHEIALPVGGIYYIYWTYLKLQ